MNKVDKLQDMLQSEMADQILYNHYMLTITAPEVRQLFIQFRDEHVQHITQLQQQIKQLTINNN